MSHKKNKKNKKNKEKEFLTVKDLISKLKEFNPKLPVVITDGRNCVCYRGLFDIKEFEDTVDIGVGDTRLIED